MKYTITSRSARDHLVAWDDGVEALVKGPWEASAEVARGRADHVSLSRLAHDLAQHSSGLRAAASMADRAAMECQVAASIHADARRATVQASVEPKEEP